MESTSISRRQALRLLLGASAYMAASARPALAVTESDIKKTKEELASAQARYDEVAAQLDEIATQYEGMSQELAQTLEDIDGVNQQIASTEEQISQKETELQDKRTRLSKRIRSAYKSGGDNAISTILSSQSFEELDSNIYYLDKISENDRLLIEEVEQLKADLEEHQVELEEQRSELEVLKGQQEESLTQMQAKQEEVQGILSGLDADVQALINKRDEEIMQLSREREEQKKREEEAARQSAAAASSATSEDVEDDSEGSASGGVTGTISDGSTTGSQARVIAACKSTGSPGSGLCAMWVSMVFNNAGFSYAGGNANDMYNWWTTSSNRADLKPGMIVAVSTHSHTSAGRIYGHIGIYIGDGIMMDNIGYIRTISVNEWIAFYSTTVTPRWGWLMGIPLA